MESLENVVAVLRHEAREDLAALLADARVSFEYIDTAFGMNGITEWELTNATVYASISSCKALRELDEDDKDAILDAFREVWPASEEGGTVIQNVAFNIDKNSLRNDTTLLFTSPIGWHSVDRTMARIRELLATASTSDHFQEVGVLCRQSLISVARIVYDPTQHAPLPNQKSEPSKNDAKGMIARYLASECPGPENQAIRKSTNGAIELANRLTHSRSTVYRDAALCAQATFNVIGLIALISGKQEQK